MLHRVWGITVRSVVSAGSPGVGSETRFVLKAMYQPKPKWNRGKLVLFWLGEIFGIL